ncbi:hypothetical protein CGGC5_v013065 [Colletotrichum fructicola Nara gc5]|uniref:Uncharacterized protein n=1 Tax=Colletotrichum fructicola (strain Nara gc5) TaxID=1213859 RepID=A0A7J6IKR3_COLFN|nr:hypothetical protein CGGC5_v013065 [Colletotrichum fructicola Nara gc5]
MTLYSHFDMESRGKDDRASLERERDAWFAILESYRLRFRLERERIRVACKRAEQSVWVNLANQAWCISQEALPVDVIKILCSYQAEIRQRRLEDLQQDRDRRDTARPTNGPNVRSPSADMRWRRRASRGTGIPEESVPVESSSGLKRTSLGPYGVNDRAPKPPF